MEVETIFQLIGSWGFPLVLSVYLLYQSKKDREQHAEEMKRMADALNNNTRALQHLADLVGGDLDG